MIAAHCTLCWTQAVLRVFCSANWLPARRPLVSNALDRLWARSLTCDGGLPGSALGRPAVLAFTYPIGLFTSQKVRPLTQKGRLPSGGLGRLRPGPAAKRSRPPMLQWQQVDADVGLLGCVQQAVELLKDNVVLPDMELDPWQARWQAFDNRNGLNPDPVAEVRREV